jgi:hypothetical protein
MARRSRLIPIASSANSEPRLSITENWGRIEKAYGHPLPDNVRQEILKETKSFLRFEVFERTAQPLRDAIDYVSSIKSAGNSLQNALAGLFDGPVDASSYAESLIKRHFSDPRLAGYGPFNALSDMLTSLTIACNL